MFNFTGNQWLGVILIVLVVVAVMIFVTDLAANRFEDHRSTLGNDAFVRQPHTRFGRRNMVVRTDGYRGASQFRPLSKGLVVKLRTAVTHQTLKAKLRDLTDQRELDATYTNFEHNNLVRGEETNRRRRVFSSTRQPAKRPTANAPTDRSAPDSPVAAVPVSGRRGRKVKPTESSDTAPPAVDDDSSQADTVVISRQLPEGELDPHLLESLSHEPTRSDDQQPPIGQAS